MVDNNAVLIGGIAGMVALTCCLLVIYPYVIYPLLLRILPGRPVVTGLHDGVTASLLFCAYNEERSLPEKIKNLELLKKRHPGLQFLAYDDGSSDATARLLGGRPDLIEFVPGAGRCGKAHGMKLLAARATGDILIFTDANVVLREDAVENLAAWYSDPSVGGVCGSLHYLGDEESITADVGSAYWKLEEFIKRHESRTGNVMGGDGSVFSLRRALYPTFPDTVLDDLTVSMAAVFAGKRLIKVEDVVAFEKLVTARGEEFSRKIRISARAFHTHLYLRDQLTGMRLVDKFKYFSHKSIRWFGGAFLLLGVVSALVAVATFSIKGFALLSGLIALISLAALKVRRGPLAAFIEICLAMSATLIGVYKAMRGRTVSTWAPAKSR